MSHRHSFVKLLIRRLRWEPYDPTWLVELARANEPGEPWLAETLARCSRGAWECDAYLYFIDPKDRAASFRENIVLESPTEGDLVLDVLTDRSVAGVEFLSRL